METEEAMVSQVSPEYWKEPVPAGFTDPRVLTEEEKDKIEDIVFNDPEWFALKNKEIR